MEPKFVIDGREYAFPDMDTVTMGEALVLYDYSGLSLDEVAEAGSHPGVLAALMHIAYARGNPGVKKDRVRALIEGSNLADAVSKFTEQEEEPLPPAGRQSGPQASASDESGNGSSSGSSSENTGGLAPVSDLLAGSGTQV